MNRNISRKHEQPDWIFFLKPQNILMVDNLTYLIHVVDHSSENINMMFSPPVKCLIVDEDTIMVP